MSTKSGAEWREKNQADWDERVPIHLHTAAYGVYVLLFFITFYSSRNFSFH